LILHGSIGQDYIVYHSERNKKKYHKHFGLYFYITYTIAD